MDNHQEVPEVIDQTVIQSLKELGGEDDPGLFVELVHLFLSDTPERIKDLENAMRAGDATAVERAAHGLKSSSANLGAMMLSDLFKRIEMAGRNKDLGGAAPLVGQTQQRFLEVERALRAEIV